MHVIGRRQLSIYRGQIYKIIIFHFKIFYKLLNFLINEEKKMEFSQKNCSQFYIKKDNCKIPKIT
jgi:hypothetical protein